MTIRGLLTPKGFAEAFGGNLVVMDVYAAQELFGRGRRFDRLEVRLEEGVTLEAATASLRAVVPPNVKVETPDRRSAQMEKLVANFAAGFDVTSGFALGLGAFLIYNAFSVAVNRRRRDIGTLRALGATPRQVQALFLLEALALGLVGSILGVLAGVGLTRAALDVMRQGAEQVYGVTASSQARLTPAARPPGARARPPRVARRRVRPVARRRGRLADGGLREGRPPGGRRLERAARRRGTRPPGGDRRARRAAPRRGDADDPGDRRARGVLGASPRRSRLAPPPRASGRPSSRASSRSRGASPPTPSSRPRAGAPGR